MQCVLCYQFNVLSSGNSCFLCVLYVSVIIALDNYTVLGIGKSTNMECDNMPSTFMARVLPLFRKR